MEITKAEADISTHLWTNIFEARGFLSCFESLVPVIFLMGGLQQHRGFQMSRKMSRWFQGDEADVQGVPWGQRRHLIGPLMICKAVQVSKRVQGGQGGC